MMRGGMLRRRRSDDGAAAVEFALVVPLLLLLVFAIISYGVMLSFRQTLSQATTEGARAGAVALLDADRTGNAQDAVNDALGPSGVECDGTTLKRGTTTVGTCSIGAAQDCQNGAAGQMCLEVTLAYNYRDNALVPSFFGIDVFLPKTLTYTADARVS